MVLETVSQTQGSQGLVYLEPPGTRAPTRSKRVAMALTSHPGYCSALEAKVVNILIVEIRKYT